MHFPSPLGLDPDLPLTGTRLEVFTAEINNEVAAKLAAFRRLYLPYPRHTQFHAQCDYLVKLGRATPGQPQLGLRVLAPSGSGKTTAAVEFVRLMSAGPLADPRQVPVVIVALEKGATSKKLMSSILTYFGDGFAMSGNEMTLKRRVQACFRHFSTELLIIDEVQHLSLGRHGANDVTDSLKRFLDDGIVPLVFLGTDDAADLFTRNLQLNGRLLPPCDFRPLDVDDPNDHTLLRGFVDLLDQEIFETGILAQLAGLQAPWIVGCLHTVSGGVIGRISRLMAVALEIALRRGAACVEVYDLALAVDRWAIPHGFIKANPFRGAKQ